MPVTVTVEGRWQDKGETKAYIIGRERWNEPLLGHWVWQDLLVTLNWCERQWNWVMWPVIGQWWPSWVGVLGKSEGTQGKSRWFHFHSGITIPPYFLWVETPNVYFGTFGSVPEKLSEKLATMGCFEIRDCRWKTITSECWIYSFVLG